MPHPVFFRSLFGGAAAVVLATGPAAATPDASTAACVADVVAQTGFHGALAVGDDAGLVAAFAVDGENGAAGSFGIDTRFNVGSMYKMITAVAVGRLVDDGRVAFDDPIGRHMPDLPAAFQDLTVGEVLSHTAGIGNLLTPGNISAIRGHVSIDDLMPLVLADAPGPRGEFRYSNSGFVLLGKLIEDVTGERYEDYTRTHVLEPAGMTATSLFADGATALNYTRMSPDSRPGDDNDGAPLVESDLRLPRGMPAGGGYTTVGDLVRFGSAVRGGRLATPETVAALTRPHADLRESPRGAESYGYGFIIRDGGASFGHGGGAPGVNGELRVRTDSPWIVATLGNIDPPQASEMAEAVERALTDPEDPAYCF